MKEYVQISNSKGLIKTHKKRLGEYTLNKGKYAGYTLDQVFDIDLNYIYFMAFEIESDFFKSYLKEVQKQVKAKKKKAKKIKKGMIDKKFVPKSVLRKNT